MPGKSRSRIAFIFLGGSVIDTRGRRGDQVGSAAEVERWMDAMSETDIIADTQGFFVADGLKPVGISEWKQAADIIASIYPEMDGFVIVHDVSTIPAAATAMRCMCQHLDKPIILVGSPLGSGRIKPATKSVQDFGSKAAFINAVQVATSNIAGVFAVFGSHIFDSIDMSLETDGHLNGTIIGKVDFGVRLTRALPAPKKKGFRLSTEFASDVLIIDWLPGVDSVPMQRPKDPAGIFLTSSEPAGFEMYVDQLLSQLNSKIPVAVYSTDKNATFPAQTFVLHDATRSGALIRFRWALGQSHDPQKIRKILMGSQ